MQRRSGCARDSEGLEVIVEQQKWYIKKFAMHAYTMATAMSLEDTLDPSIKQLLLLLKTSDQ